MPSNDTGHVTAPYKLLYYYLETVELGLELAEELTIYHLFLTIYNKLEHLSYGSHVEPLG